QHSAIIDAMKDQNLVIQGPPGTGKSQTITNIIANALAQGKRILFLCEKQAALDAVKKRLDAVSLGVFCLELHSEKATTRNLVERLKLRLSESGGGSPEADRHTAIDYTRAQIHKYLSILHQETKGQSTPYQLMASALRSSTRHKHSIEKFSATSVKGI